MAVAALKYVTEDEYLAQEICATEKHEWLAGQVYAMAGGTPEHSLIAMNIGRELGNLAKDRPCSVYSSDLRVRVAATGLNTYPDVTMVCGELKRTKQRPPAATNPTLIVEVLSESTQEYDRGGKWRHFQTLETLTDYILVWQDRPWVEHYSRLSPDRWQYRLVDGLGQSLPIESLAGELPLIEVYRGISFPEIPPLRDNLPPDSE